MWLDGPLFSGFCWRVRGTLSFLRENIFLKKLGQCDPMKRRRVCPLFTLSHVVSYPHAELWVVLVWVSSNMATSISSLTTSTFWCNQFDLWYGWADLMSVWAPPPLPAHRCVSPCNLVHVLTTPTLATACERLCMLFLWELVATNVGLTSNLRTPTLVDVFVNLLFHVKEC